ncbi:DUF4249 domain-containing protein [Nafulsella turpanensis]|uniref:DUF4249 domain-containing protein n=1 Tax=Nafulsella turpanensis TaxID=1265690 RepID=UPI00135F12A5|nr:DUF4249 domain-containing protein [Nafulsella turpanensis]
MKQDVELDLPAAEQQLIVECYLEPGGQYKALVTKSLSFFESTQLEGVDTAQIVISSGDKEIKLQNLRHADTLNKKVYNYWHPKEVKYEEGKEYQISISFDNEIKVSGKTRFLPIAPILKVYPELRTDTTAALFVEIEDNPREENYYRVVIKSPNPQIPPTYDKVWADDNSNRKFTVKTPVIFKMGWKVAVNVYHIDKKYYNFLKSSQQARDANYNPFMQPATIESTLDGATGVFTAISLSSDTVVIE